MQTDMPTLVLLMTQQIHNTIYIYIYSFMCNIIIIVV